MRESAIEKRVVAWAKAHGIYTRKFSSPAHRGVPDRIFVGEGTSVFIEFKRPGKEPTDLQRRELKFLNDRNVAAVWSDDADEAIKFLKMYFGCD